METKLGPSVLPRTVTKSPELLDELLDEFKTRQSLIPLASEWKSMREQADVLVHSGLLPRRIDTPEKLLAIALVGRRFGLDMWSSIRGVYISDDGTPALHSTLMLGLIQEAGGQVQWLERTATIARLQTRARGERTWTPYAFTIDDAHMMGLVERRTREGKPYKSLYQKNPRVGLQWRVVAEMARAHYSHVLFGLTAPGAAEELSGGESFAPPEDAIETEAIDSDTGEVLPAASDETLSKLRQMVVDGGISWEHLTRETLGAPLVRKPTQAEAEALIAAIEPAA